MATEPHGKARKYFFAIIPYSYVVIIEDAASRERAIIHEKYRSTLQANY